MSAVANAAMRLVFRVRVEGDSNVPAQGSAIIAFNHVSVIDGPAVGIVVARRCRRTRFLVAAEIFEKTAGVDPPLLRSDPDPARTGRRARARPGISTVKAGAIAALAPEGRVNDDGVTEMLRFHRGVARLALATGAPVVPVGLWGTQTRWPRSGRR